MQAYEGKKRVRVDVSYNGNAIIYIEKDLKGKVDYIKYRNINSNSLQWKTQQNKDYGNKFIIKGYGEYEVTFHKMVTIDGNGNKIWNTILWRQNIYIPYPQPVISEELAKQYNPVVVFNRDEEYFPQSLDTILSFNNDDNNNSIEISEEGWLFDASNNKSARSKHKMGEDIKNYLKFNGHSKAYFNFKTYETICELSNDKKSCKFDKPLFLRYLKGSIDNSVVYWDASKESDFLYLTYYFFYAFDPKKGSFTNPGGAAHAFDRESFTIRFSIENNKYIPTNVTYAGHLSNQRIDFNGCKEHSSCDKETNDLLSWKGGKTTIGWDNIIKIGKHPVIYKAKGSHAIYPTYGHYTVVNLGTDLVASLEEPAGSVIESKLMLPDTYKLKKLDYSTLGYLSFSGFWVDVRNYTGFGENARFPPFIRTPYDHWLLDTNYVFDSCIDGSDSSCSDVKEYFKYVRGLNKFSAITVEVRDKETDEIIPNAQVGLDSEDGSLEASGITLSDGTHTFFYKPKARVAYQILAYTPDYGKVDCGKIYVMDTSKPILNNMKNIVCYMADYSENHPPIASNKRITMLKNSSITSNFIVTDEDNDELTFEITQDPLYGVVQVEGSKFIYTPSFGYNGYTDSFKYTASDQTDVSNIATVSIRMVMRADVNNDRNIDTLDIALMERYLAGFDMSTTDWIGLEFTGDVDCNESVDTIDLALIQQYVAGFDMSKTTWCSAIPAD